MAISAEDRYERERAFHDERFSTAERAADRFYGTVDLAADEAFFGRLSSLQAPADVLDYGCGAGAYIAIHLAQLGHRVVAVDLSQVAITLARARAEKLGVVDRIDFRVGNAEALDLPDSAFDLVAGAGVLHHLDLEVAYFEIARILRPGKEAIFSEPMGHNPAINLYRDRTPDQRSVDEHPLVMDDFELARGFFARVEPQFFALTSLLAVPFDSARGNKALIDRLDAIDRVLFRRVPVLRRYAWMVVLTLGSPCEA
jgi:SAM-dependent methyltransferase